MVSGQITPPVRTLSQGSAQPDAIARERPVADVHSLRPYVLITTVLFLLSSVPYLLGYLRESPGTVFSGIVFNVSDTSQYFAWMRSFSDSVLIANPLTPEPGENRFFNLQWWLLGLLAYKTPLGLVLTYHLLRVLALAAFAASVVWFCRLVIPRRTLLAFALVMVSSGFGWVWVLEKRLSGELRHPLDVEIAEANTFFSAMAFPHLLIAGAMMVTIFCLCLTAADERRWSRIIGAGALTLALGFSHGYDLIPTVIIPAATALVLLVRRSQIPGLAWPVGAVGIAAGPPALYALGLTILDDTWSGVLSQYANAGVFTPLPHHLIILLGLPFLLALPQLRPAAWKGINDRQLFVRMWFVVGFFLLYIPTDYQIKMLTAYQIPACILAAGTLGELARSRLFTHRYRFRLVPAALLATVAFVMLTNVYLLAWRVVDLNRGEYAYYLTTGDVEALRALDDVVQPGDVVLSSETLGMYVPVYSDARPYVAHWAMTLRFYERRAATAWFYAGQTSAVERAAFLEAHGIDFVLSGPAEAALTGQPAPPGIELDTLMVGQTTLYGVHPADRVAGD